MLQFKNTLLAASLGAALGSGGLALPAQAAENDHPVSLTFRYTGDSCAAWSNSQAQQASCLDYLPGGAAKVHVVAFEPLEGVAVWYEGVVKIGKEFTLDALNGKRFALIGQSMVLQISDLQGTLLQEVEIVIDDPLVLQKDDIYGGLTLKKVSYKFKAPKQYKDNQYIVGFNDQTDWDAVEDYAEYWKTYGVEVPMELPLVNALVLRVPDFVTPADLASDPRVNTVHTNQKIAVGELLNAQGKSFIRPFGRNKPEKKEYPWSIAKLFDQFYDYDSIETPTVMLSEDAMPDVVQLAMQAVEGAHLRIAVFDTGIEDHHKNAGRKVSGGVSVIVSNEKGEFPEGNPGDDNGHGTHVAGILAASLDKKLNLGKDAKIELYAVKMLDRYATGNLSNIVMGLQWAINNDIDIINMSLGYSSDSPIVKKAIQEAARTGVIMVASAGNRSNYDDSVMLRGMSEGGAGEGGAGEGGAGEGGAGEGGAGEGGAGEGGAGEGGAGEGGAGEGGAGESNMTCDSLPLYAVMYPARYPEVIAVGASNRWGELSTFSNSGPEIDIMAPGEDILSWDITNGNIAEGFGSTSGTSMSAPHVTAAVVMMVALDPTLSVQEIREILLQTADYGAYTPAGDLNLMAALNEVLSRLIGKDTSAYARKQLESEYKKILQEKIENARD